MIREEEKKGRRGKAGRGVKNEPVVVSACLSGSSEGRSLATLTAQLAQFLVVFVMWAYCHVGL